MLLWGAVMALRSPWAGLWARAPLAAGLVLLAARARRLASLRRAPPHGWLVVDDHGVRRVAAGGESRLVDWREPFGATVLGSSDRARFLIALTTPRSVRYVAARAADRDDVAAAPTLVERATTAADSDLRVDDDAALTAVDAERLLAAVAARAPASLDRLYLSNAAGESIVLERGELRVGGRSIDLALPVEWRAAIFQERGAQAASVCQATWVRQGDSEFVLVAPLPADGTWLRDGDVPSQAPAGDARVLHRALARDLRLMQAAITEPPPRELRCAIERLFMLPLRRALDRAPRADAERPRETRGRSPRASHP